MVIYQFKSKLKTSNYLKNYIKGGGHYLNFQIFFETVIHFFENEYFSNTHKIIQDLSSFFLNHVIVNHDYCCNIKKPDWLSLINIYTTSFLNYQLAMTCMEPVIALKCLRMIMNKIYVYVGSFFLSKLFSFFHLAISNLK